MSLLTKVNCYAAEASCGLGANPKRRVPSKIQPGLTAMNSLRSDPPPVWATAAYSWRDLAPLQPTTNSHI